jgi:hypothetical protein
MNQHICLRENSESSLVYLTRPAVECDPVAHYAIAPEEKSLAMCDVQAPFLLSVATGCDGIVDPVCCTQIVLVSRLLKLCGTVIPFLSVMARKLWS